MKNKFIKTAYLAIVWAVTSVSLWLTVKFLDLTSTNQFTGKMKSFELDIINSFKGMAVIMFTAVVINKIFQYMKR